MIMHGRRGRGARGIVFTHGHRWPQTREVSALNKEIKNLKKNYPFSWSKEYWQVLTCSSTQHFYVFGSFPRIVVVCSLPVLVCSTYSCGRYES